MNSTESITSYIFLIRAARAQYFICNFCFFIFFASTITKNNFDVLLYCCLLFVLNMFYHDSCCEPFMTFVSTRSLKTYYVTSATTFFLKCLGLFLLIFDTQDVSTHIVLQCISIMSQIVFDTILCYSKDSYLAEYAEEEFPFSIFTFDGVVVHDNDNDHL